MAEERPGSLRVWLTAARPRTLWAAVSPVMIGTAMAYADQTAHLWSALTALIGAVAIQVGTNYANDYFDYRKGSDSPQRIGPLRVTAAGLVTPAAMRRATAVAFGIAMAAGVYLVWRGGWPIVVIGLLSILSGILYTAGPYALAYLGVADFFVLLFFGPVAVGGTYYVQSLHLTWPVLLAGLAPGFFSTAILTVNNLRDADSDARTGKRTLAVRFGKRFSRWEYVACLLLAGAVPVCLVLAHDAPSEILTAVAAVLLAFPAVHLVFTARDGAVLNLVLAKTGQLLLLYSLLFSIGWIL